MTRMEESQALRDRTDVHYNCCQSVLVPFAGVCGLDRDTAFQLGANFGRGMRRGSACGAVTSALMVLGMAGKGSRFRERNRALDCDALLQMMDERGEEHKPNCDRLVRSAVEILEELLK